MARATPQVEHDLLTGHGGAQPIAVGSPAWYAWLDQAGLFAFRSAAGSFTARREGRERGGEYWRAYRTIAGRQRRAYLGRSADLTSERLHAAAAQLAGAAEAAGHHSPDLSPATAARVGSAPLLSTRLYLPRPRGALVPRPRLLARLEAGLALPLTLIAAPAGFGKTTLLAQGLGVGNWGMGGTSPNSHPPTPTPRSVAWLSLDDADNDPNTFLRYLIAALRTVVPAAGTLALALLDETQPPPLTTLLTTLINDLANARLAAGGQDRAEARIILVLDDYHVIGSSAVHSALSFLLEHLPPALHIVIGSREDPPLPLARLRARGQIAELRAADLRFTPDEAAAFLHEIMGLPLEADEIAALEARTEGWVAGLQLAALAMRDRADRAGFIAAFTGSNRFVIDYLASEVLDRLPALLRDFMLRTSVLERMCGPLCDELMDQRPTTKDERDAALVLRPSSLVLEELERANLFLIPLDDQRRWYRYHQLFAGVLHERLQHDTPGAEIAMLHLRASGWFERAGLMAEATQHALAAPDFERAATLIERVALPLALDGQQATVAAWLEALPANMRRERPRLSLAQGMLDGLNGDFASAAAQLQQAERSLAEWDSPDAAAVEGEIAALRTMALSMIGDPRAMPVGQTALQKLPAHHPLREITVAGLCYAAFYAGDLSTPSQMLEQALSTRQATQRPVALSTGLIAMLAMVRRAQGRLSEARQLSEQTLALASSEDRVLPLSGALLAYLLLGLAQCERNELDAAEHALRECAQLAGQYQMTMNELLAQFYLGQVLAARGDFPGALGLVEQASATAQRYLSPRNLREIAGYRALLWLRQGRLDAATAWAATYEPEAEPGRPRLTAYDYDRFALAEILIAQGRLKAARDAVERLLDDAEATNHGRFVIWSLVLRALILQAQGDLLAALASLQRALGLAEPEGYVRVFVDHGAAIVALLRETRAQGIAPEYVETLLRAFPGTESQGARTAHIKPSASVLSPQPSILAEPLSARELDVLRLLASGMDNAQIARALSVAVSTVKSHINHIFGKLGVGSRLEAVLRAQELKLL
ncbi:MAG TPA: LuxR C-terminal-related transcriptional regulator [Roseiflexaceae bacterium]|nr:LuxR C-terminal-related transcriptional regulator [Roseiflexaceae bacterium]